MSLFGGNVKQSQAASDAQAYGSAISGSSWTVRKSSPVFTLALIGAAGVLFWVWRKNKRGFK